MYIRCPAAQFVSVNWYLVLLFSHLTMTEYLLNTYLPSTVLGAGNIAVGKEFKIPSLIDLKSTEEKQTANKISK